MESTTIGFGNIADCPPPGASIFSGTELQHGIMTIFYTYCPALINLADSILLCFFCFKSLRKNMIRVLKNIGKLLCWPLYFTFKFVYFIKAKLQDEPNERKRIEDELMDFNSDEAFFEAQFQLIYQINALRLGLAQGSKTLKFLTFFLIVVSYLTVLRTSISWHLHGKLEV